jgi:hypothetical protein
MKAYNFFPLRSRTKREFTNTHRLEGIKGVYMYHNHSNGLENSFELTVLQMKIPTVSELG